MKAVCWMGTSNIQTLTVPDPTNRQPARRCPQGHSSTAICGSDLHLFDGYIPTMVPGDILGHEFMGIVEEVGPEVKNLKRGDRVVVPFTIACGNCFFCKKDLWSLCDNTNPNAQVAETMYGYSGSALFGYSHIYGGYAGGQAQYAARSARRRRLPQDRERSPRREGALPHGHLPHRLHGCGKWQYPGRRYGGRLGRGSCGSLRRRKCLHVWCAGKVIVIDRFPERLRLGSRVLRRHHHRLLGR